MNDLISRQAAIDAIYEHEFSNWCDKDEVSTILYDLPSAEPQWIPVSERLPEWWFETFAGERCVNSEPVLVCAEDSNNTLYDPIAVGRYLDGRWEILDDNFPLSGRVSAWMPLPSPYRGESE